MLTQIRTGQSAVMKNGIDLFDRGVQARRDNHPYGRSKPTLWKIGWKLADEVWAAQEAFYAGEPLDPNRSQAWRQSWEACWNGFDGALELAPLWKH